MGLSGIIRVQMGESGDKMFFFGTFKHNLDDKSRCTIPNSFRDQLGKKVYGTKGLDNCINIYPEEAFMRLCQQNALLSDFDPAERQFKRLFFETSFKYEVDKSGRITLTKDHLQRAGIDREVVLVGNNDHIEIWNKTTFEELDTIQNENFESNAQSIAQSRKELR